MIRADKDTSYERTESNDAREQLKIPRGCWPRISQDVQGQAIMVEVIYVAR